MNNDDLQRELDKLWSRVTAPPEDFLVEAPAAPAASFFDAPSITREVSMEAISLLKRQHREELLRLQQLVELKDRSIREFQDRLSAAEAENVNLRGRSRRSEEEIYQQAFSASTELETAQKGFQEAERRFQEEEKVLRSIAENTRKQLAAETARWREFERQANEREQEYLLKIRELETRTQKAMEVSATKDGAARKSAAELREAKGAVESSLAELLQERQERKAADKERDKALARVKEVEEHVRSLQNLWQEERAQWQELWDRERSTWESQRQQFGAWEEKVRKDREAYHSEMHQLQERETKFADQMAEVLRKAVGAAEKAGAMFQKTTAKAKEVMAVRRRIPIPLPRLDKRFALVAAAVVLLASAYPAWKYTRKLDFELLASHTLDVRNPTGLAREGDNLWVSEWDGRLVSLDPRDPSVVVRTVKIEKEGPYHPSSIAVFSDSLYSLDSAQGRVLRHKVWRPENVLGRWKSPGPAPLALAHDGRNLWSYDAANRVVYRHLGEGDEAGSEAYSLPIDVLPKALCWHEDKLWVYDAKGERVAIMEKKGKTLSIFESSPLDVPVQGLVLVERASKKNSGKRLEMWVLAVPNAGEPSLMKYEVHR